MDAEARAELKKKIVEEIELQKHLVDSFTATSKPVAPDNAIGRLTRMEAISSQNISEASLNSSRAKLAKLEKALGKVDLPDFGLCARCANPIPQGRIMLMPENVLCVSCAEKK
ncbi:MAG: TraR/DksA C4-type zinc finger protein [Nitrospinaceae bacterium]|nr:TraR/DksA C4-type zinc finger protein [Nitrospinaceae bacterium]